MIDAWHLVWIVPAAAMFGFSLGAWLATGKEADVRESGYRDSAWPEIDMCTGCPFNPHNNDEITTLH